MSEEQGKHVDEAWKEDARREKEELSRKMDDKKKGRWPRADFLTFLSGLAAQALMQLGELENPLQGKKVQDLEAAQYTIDLLGVLQEKTRGNRTPEETRYLEAVLYDLRMRFVRLKSAAGRETDPEHPQPG